MLDALDSMSVRRVSSLIAHLPANSRTVTAELADGEMWPILPELMPLFHAMWLVGRMWAGDGMPGPDALFHRARPRERPRSMAEWVAAFAPLGSVPPPPE